VWHYCVFIAVLIIWYQIVYHFDWCGERQYLVFKNHTFIFLVFLFFLKNLFKK